MALGLENDLFSQNDVRETVTNTAPTQHAWDLANPSFLAEVDVSGNTSAPMGLFIKPDGRKIYLTSNGTTVDEYNLSGPWDVTTATYSQRLTDAGELGNVTGIFFSPNGLKMYLADVSNSHIHEYDLSTAWDVTTATYLQEKDVSAKAPSLHALYFRRDGQRMYTTDSNSDTVDEYYLSTAWDVTTATYLTEFSVNAKDTSLGGVWFKGDGTEVFVTGRQNDKVYKYGLGVAWNTSDETYDSDFLFIPNLTNPEAICFNPAGTIMYVTDQTAEKIYAWKFEVW